MEVIDMDLLGWGRADVRNVDLFCYYGNGVVVWSHDNVDFVFLYESFG